VKFEYEDLGVGVGGQLEEVALLDITCTTGRPEAEWTRKKGG
jgi:hypothetical protein